MTVEHSVALGGSASSIRISRVNLGLMGLTWTGPDAMTPDDKAFEAMKASLISSSGETGVTTLWDAGQFYNDPKAPHANLKLVRRYFEKYPEDKDSVTLCVKGGIKIFGEGSYTEKGFGGMAAQTSIEVLRETIQQIREALGSDQGGKDVDIWEPARFPTGKDAPSVEEMISTYLKLQDEGLFKHLGLSEVSGPTIEKAVKASNNGIASVEIEYSPFELAGEEHGVLQVCEKYKLPILAYSPVGKGLLTGAIRSRDDIPKGDPRLFQDRFTEENFSLNIKLVDSFKHIADAHSLTPSQVCLAWILHRSSQFAPIPGTRQAKYAKENAEASKIELTKEELKEVDELLRSLKPAGGRYTSHARDSGTLWA